MNFRIFVPVLISITSRLRAKLSPKTITAVFNY